jgi:Carboxypeptidase Taq (M32) metallopeptidase
VRPELIRVVEEDDETLPLERRAVETKQTVPSDAQGCLQDVHWSCLSMGYFPTYLIGSAQLGHYCQQDIRICAEPGLDVLLQDQVCVKWNPHYFSYDLTQEIIPVVQLFGWKS